MANNNVKDEATKETYEIYKATQKVNNHLTDILAENFSYTDKNGKTWTIDGVQNDTEKEAQGIYGLEKIFELPEFKGQPFREASRNAHSHFKTYCIANGLTEAELAELSGDEVSDELKDKLRDYKKEFMKMIIDKDLDKISNMYVYMAKEIENDKEKFETLSVDDPDDLKNKKLFFLKYSGAQSWYGQTFDYQGKNATEKINEVVKMIDDKLKADGKLYEFSSLKWPLDTIDTVCQASANLEPEYFEDEESKGMIEMANRKANAVIVSLRKEIDSTKNKEGFWLNNVRKGYMDSFESFSMLEMAPEYEFTKEAFKYIPGNRLSNYVDGLLNNIKDSGTNSHRNSDLSGKMYQQIRDLKESIDRNIEISPDALDELKETATKYLSYKNKEGYNKNAYGKIVAANGVLSFIEAYNNKDVNLLEDASLNKQNVEDIMNKVKADPDMVKAYNKGKEKVSFNDLLANEISEDNKKINVTKAQKNVEKNVVKDTRSKK